MALQDIVARVQAAVRAQTAALQARLQRSTPRERALIGLLVLGAVIYAPIMALDWRSQQEDRYTAALTERSAARLARNAAARVAANPTATAALEDMEQWGFDANNVAIAQVRIEQRLLSTAAEVGLTNVVVATDPTLEQIGPTQWLKADIQADLRWTPTFAFLDAVTQWPEGFRVIHFEFGSATPGAFVNPDLPPPTGRVRIGLAFPVSIPQAASPQANGTRAPAPTASNLQPPA